MDQGAGGGLRNSVGMDGGPDRSGTAGLSSTCGVDKTEQAAMWEPWVFVDGVGDSGPQQSARKRSSTSAIVYSWLRKRCDVAGDWLGRETVSSRKRCRLSPLAGMSASRYLRMFSCVVRTSVSGVGVVCVERQVRVVCGVEVEM